MPALTFQRTVLLVDDDEDLRLMLAAALRVEGHAVIDVQSGEAALAALEHAPQIQAQSRDLVVSDLMMPGMGGMEFLRRLRQMARWVHMPILVLTGVNDPMLPVRLDLPVAFKPDVLDTIRRFAESMVPDTVGGERPAFLGSPVHWASRLLA